jgi:cobaltochelatase CobN
MIEVANFFTPPSVLPDISPTRGEIIFSDCLRQSPATAIRACIRLVVISPLEGEMSGRTEGGDSVKASAIISRSFP